MHYFGMGHIPEQIFVWLIGYVSALDSCYKIHDKLSFLRRVCGKSITALLDY